MVATLKNETVDTWAHWILTSLQVLDDSAGLEAFINSVLLAGLARKVDASLGTQLVTLAPPLVVTADNLADACLYARAEIDDQGRTATTAALNTGDYIALLTMKTSTGEYLFDADLAQRIGLNLVAGSAIPAGQVLVFDSSIGALLERQTPTVEVSREDSDNFRRNMVTLLAECRLLLALYDLNGIMSVSLTPPAP
ncbi:phage major capsid protein [Paraburkholderia atlantica]|uniref:phage major capsid protein n=1 Tax=Paraburkholderia atlantica TaxID=2654982 RepID=UPI000A037845